LTIFVVFLSPSGDIRGYYLAIGRLIPVHQLSHPIDSVVKQPPKGGESVGQQSNYRIFRKHETQEPLRVTRDTVPAKL
jgi:hypothetical protein